MISKKDLKAEGYIMADWEQGIIHEEKENIHVYVLTKKPRHCKIFFT